MFVAQPVRFSVVMPAYNAAATIVAAIESVLAQEFAGWELVITDDGSTDETRAICDRYVARDERISVASQPNAGAGAAISAAIERATGEYVVQLGADDELLPEFCSATSAFIDGRPGFDIYASNAYRLMPDGSRRLYHTAPRFRREFSLTVDDMLDEPLIYGTAAFRRELFAKVGGFRAEFYNEDYDFWLRALMAGAKHIYNPRPLALYRVVPGQKTEDGVRMRQEDIRILRDAIAGGSLTAEQVEHAERTLSLLEGNVAFRRRVIRLVGPRMAQPVFRAAHKLAWLVRPSRRQK
jgi:glycosyltransferase involved in cell wall biosynthesis